MDILDIMIYLIFMIVFGLNLVSIILKIKAKKRRGEPVFVFKRRFIKVPKELYYYFKNMEFSSEHSRVQGVLKNLEMNPEVENNSGSENTNGEPGPEDSKLNGKKTCMNGETGSQENQDNKHSKDKCDDNGI